MYDDTHETKFAAFDSAGNETFTIVAATTGKKIRVLAYVVSITGTQTVKFQSKPSGTATDLTGKGLAVPASTTTIVSAGYNPRGWFETTLGSALQAVSSAAGNVGGHLTYILV